jgi:hypothetical protein
MIKGTMRSDIFFLRLEATRRRAANFGVLSHRVREANIDRGAAGGYSGYGIAENGRK